jgi:GT2 family glycosyltransferase
VYEPGLVSVIVVNYRTEKYLAECLRSVRQQDYARIELVLVNNGSPEFALSVCDEFHPEVFLENPRNLGFARANNQGILHSRGEFVLLLNADAWLEDGFVSRAVEEFARDASIGTVVPRIHLWRDPHTVESTGHLMRTDFTAAHRDHFAPAALAEPSSGFVFGGTAACIVYRRQMLEAVRFRDEFFDEGFFAYYEDVDLDLRAQLVGFKAWYQPQLVAHHIGAGSGGRKSRRLRLVAEKNRYLSLAKCLTAADWLPSLPQLALYEVYHFLKNLAAPYLFLAIFGYLYYLPRALRKRLELQRRRVLPPRELRKLLAPRFGRKSRLVKTAASEYATTASVVVINYNGLADTRKCLDGLAEQDFPDFETIVVDNGSANDEAVAIGYEYPTVRVVQTGVNTGFAGGANAGFIAARAKYVVLLNNDAVPEPGFLRELVGAMEKTGADAGCGVLLEGDAPTTNDTLNLLGRSIPAVFREQALTFYPSGGAAIIRAESVRKLGGELFIPGYFIYHEDVSLGFRLRMAGGEVIKIPQARARHEGGATTHKLPYSRVRYYQTRNRLLNRCLYYEARTLLKLLPLCIGECIVHHVSALADPRELAAVLSVDGFMLANFFGVLGERRRLGALRHSRPLAKNVNGPTRDREFTHLLSGRLTASEGGVLNTLSLGWLRLVGLECWESRRQSL